MSRNIDVPDFYTGNCACGGNCACTIDDKRKHTLEKGRIELFGWTCPLCGACFSPNQMVCLYCGPKTIVGSRTLDSPPVTGTSTAEWRSPIDTSASSDDPRLDLRSYY